MPCSDTTVLIDRSDFDEVRARYGQEDLKAARLAVLREAIATVMAEYQKLILVVV